MNYTLHYPKIYLDVQKDKNLCDTEKALLSLVISYAKKNKWLYVRNWKLAKILQVSVGRAKNILTRLEQLGHIRRKRTFRKHHIYVHPNSEYFANHSLWAFSSQHWKSDDRNLYLGDNIVDRVTLLGPYTIYNIYKQYNTKRAVHDVNNSFFKKEKKTKNGGSDPPPGDFSGSRYLKLIISLAKRRLLELKESVQREICFHIKFGLEKSKGAMNVCQLANQAISLFLSGEWGTPYAMRGQVSSVADTNEKTYIERWQKDKDELMSSCRRSSSDENNVQSVGGLVR